MNSYRVGIDLGVTSEHVGCISDGNGKLSKKTIRFSLSQDELDKQGEEFLNYLKHLTENSPKEEMEKGK